MGAENRFLCKLLDLPGEERPHKGGITAMDQLPIILLAFVCISYLLILLFHKNKTIFPARIAPDFVIGLGNTQSIPCARCLV